MTIIEMHDLADQLIDKANAPWFKPAEKDRFINLSQVEFAETRYGQFEFNERRRQELGPIVRRFTDVNTSTINLDLIPDFLFVLNLRAEFDDGCGSTIWEKVSPIQLDDEGENDNDPFNESSDENPGYTQENNGTNTVILIESDTVPVQLIMKYLKRPVNVFNDVNNPLNNINSEMAVNTHEEIVNIAVRKMLATLNDQLHYQLQNNEINQQE